MYLKAIINIRTLIHHDDAYIRKKIDDVNSLKVEGLSGRDLFQMKSISKEQIFFSAEISQMVSSAIIIQTAKKF